jgi:hypothetical protein
MNPPSRPAKLKSRTRHQRQTCREQLQLQRRNSQGGVHSRRGYSNSNDEHPRRAYTRARLHREDGAEVLVEKFKSPDKRKPKAVNATRLDCHYLTVQGPPGEVARTLVELTKVSLKCWDCEWCRHRLVDNDYEGKDFLIKGREAVCGQCSVKTLNPEYNENSVVAGVQDCVVMRWSWEI